VITEKILEKLHPVIGYGNREIFQKRLVEGYIEAAFGSGEWVGEYRIVRLWIFFKPDGAVATYEHPKADQEGGLRHGQPVEVIYSMAEFQLYVKKWLIKFGQKVSLADIVERWPNT